MLTHLDTPLFNFIINIKKRGIFRVNIHIGELLRKGVFSVSGVSF